MSEEFRVSVVIDGSEADSIMVYKEDLEETGEVNLTVTIDAFFRAKITQED